MRSADAAIVGGTLDPAAQRLACLTIDFDTVARDLFRPAISASTARRLEVVSFDRVLPRLLDWLAAVRVHATFFSIGETALRFPDAFRRIAASGHEIANHTQTHPRHFHRLDGTDLKAEIVDAHAVLTRICGAEPVGLRAPGYTISKPVLRVLRDLGYEYEASVVPSFMYTSVKKLYRVLGGRAYRQYLHPQGFACARAPKLPYRVDPERPFERHSESALLEIPISTTPVAHIPLIYGFHTRGGSLVQRGVEWAGRRRPFFSIAFHDLEFATREDFGPLPIGELTKLHVKRPIEHRLARLTTSVERARRTHQFVTMREVARRYTG
jgi:peptidoglycan/xylan/chitin deacetylase (PgdA/CDA1 family)